MRRVLLAIVGRDDAFAAQDGARAQSFTSLQFANATGSSVTAWLGWAPNRRARLRTSR